MKELIPRDDNIKSGTELRLRWLEELESGEHTQVRDTMRSYSYGASRDGFCCLGVLEGLMVGSDRVVGDMPIYDGRYLDLLGDSDTTKVSTRFVEDNPDTDHNVFFPVEYTHEVQAKLVELGAVTKPDGITVAARSGFQFRPWADKYVTADQLNDGLGFSFRQIAAFYRWVWGWEKV